METVVIAGVGLIGGSFAKALKQHGLARRILGIDRPEVLAEALELGIIDEPAEWNEGVSRADLVYLATPISKIIELLPVADAALFQGRPYFLTPCGRPEERDSLEILTRLVSVIGGRARLIPAEVHDEMVAFTSHLPQLLSTGLAEVLGRVPGAEDSAGPGALDMTRLAGSSYDLWKDILDTNTDAVRRAIVEYVAQLKRMEAQLSEAGMRKHFEEAKKFAKLLHKK
jgi:prephenate dehydrogenase